MFIDRRIAVRKVILEITQSRENAAVRFEKPEIRDQFADSQMRSIGDKARIARKRASERRREEGGCRGCR